MLFYSTFVYSMFLIVLFLYVCFLFIRFFFFSYNLSFCLFVVYLMVIYVLVVVFVFFFFKQKTAYEIRISDWSSDVCSSDLMIIAVAGCVAQAEGEVILDRAPYVDMVFGPQTYHELPEMVARVARSTGRGLLNTDFPSESKFDFLPEESGSQGVSAFLAVQEGCDKFCTFCVVPYTRGAEYSRPAAQILDEARRLAGGGSREIHLLGQNVNAYHGEAPDGGVWGLGRLIRPIAEIDGVERIRSTTSHPRD